MEAVPTFPVLLQKLSCLRCWHETPNYSTCSRNRTPWWRRPPADQEGIPAPTTTSPKKPSLKALFIALSDRLGVKNDSLATDVTEFEMIEGETYRIESMFGNETLEDPGGHGRRGHGPCSGRTLLAMGWKNRPEFTLSNGETVGFSTASADAGVDYDLTLRIEE